MRAQEFVGEVKTRLDAKCWSGMHKQGTKIKGGVRVNNCVPNRSVKESSGMYLRDLALVATHMPNADFWIIRKGSQQQVGRPVTQYQPQYMGVKVTAGDKIDPKFLYYVMQHLHNQGYWAARSHGTTGLKHIRIADVADVAFAPREGSHLDEAAAWQKKSGKNKNGGLNKKGVASYRRQHPGSKLQTAVTTKPGKLKKGSKASKRRKSFCARMKGMKKHRTSAKTAHDPNSRINKSLRKWHC